MQTEDQTRTIDFLASLYPNTERIDTHISHLFLSEGRVFKLKRAVTFSYLDYATAKLRKQACEAEVTFNSRTAPTLYKGMRAITEAADGTLSLDGRGKPIDWVIDMARFDESTRFDRLVREGGLDRHRMEDLACAIASFHDEADVRTDMGGLSGMTYLLDSNDGWFDEVGGGVFPPDVVQRYQASIREQMNTHGDLLEERRQQGFVRHCHGDLHLGNICLVEDQATPFDCIEFNENIACIDVLYDLAFTLMDLEHFGSERLANILLNRYLDATGDVEGLALLPLFLANRAAIRALVEATQVPDKADNKKEKAIKKANGYLNRALTYLDRVRPRLIAVGGLSGSGKSRMGREVAAYVGPRPGARVVRTDVVRKKLMGVTPLTRLGPEGYTRDVTKKTYQAFYDELTRIIRSGHSAIADAVFAKASERKRVEDLARSLNVPFDGLWLEASIDVREGRVDSRTNNPSDATIEIARQQEDYDIGLIEWATVDTDRPRDESLRLGLDHLKLPKSF